MLRGYADWIGEKLDGALNERNGRRTRLEGCAGAQY